MHAEERTQLLILLKDFKEFLEDTLGDRSTESIDFGIKPGSKPFNSKYYSVPRINKETFRNELRRLLEIRVITTVQQSQYSTPAFIIPKKEGNVRFIIDYCRLNHKLVRKPYPF